MDRRLLLKNRTSIDFDPGMGVARHADAGYEIAINTAKNKGVHIPMLKGDVK